MSEQTLTSVGIDIGTTTTQVVVSTLEVGTAGHSGGGKLLITDRDVLYRGDIHRTPLLDARTIDASETASIVEGELVEATLTPADIDTGAVIVTGETARKRNAEQVVHRLALDSGDFVTATAGAALEAVLAGRGAGAAARAAEQGTTIANVDIGGGTTNIVVFGPDGILDTRCINIGGRLVEFDENGVIKEISKPVERLADSLELSIDASTQGEDSEGQRLVATMAECVVDAVAGPPFSDHTRSMAIGSLPSQPVELDEVSFSGGVGRLINKPSENNAEMSYSDIGSALAVAIRERLSEYRIVQLDEDVQATVIGAGTQTTQLSGRTLSIDTSLLPLRDLPVVTATALENAGSEQLTTRLKNAITIADKRYGTDEPFVLCIETIGSLTYERIDSVASAIAAAYHDVIKTATPVLVLVHQNCAKALGQTLNTYFGGRPVLVIDEVEADEGDFIDIGSPLSNSTTVPITVKTLAFGS